jgi:sugar fermentation stimulation protein A
MKWKLKAQKGVFLRRYKRFFGDFELNGRTEVAHVANTGSLKTVLSEGAECLVWPSDNPERKLKWTLFALRSPDQSCWIGIDTSLPNKLILEVIQQKLNPAWTQFDDFKAEVKISKETRLDGAFLKNGEIIRYLEIKNVTMAINGQAQFPDAVTERGLKHLETLIQLRKNGYETELCFFIQRTDCKSFSAASGVDPKYAEGLNRARDAGVFVDAWEVRVDEEGAVWTGNSLELK